MFSVWYNLKWNLQHFLNVVNKHTQSLCYRKLLGKILHLPVQQKCKMLLSKCLLLLRFKKLTIFWMTCWSYSLVLIYMWMAYINGSRSHWAMWLRKQKILTKQLKKTNEYIIYVATYAPMTAEMALNMGKRKKRSCSLVMRNLGYHLFHHAELHLPAC